MRGRKPESRPTFTAEQIEGAQEAVRKHSTSQAKARRARLVLLLAEDPGMTSSEAGRRVGWHPQTVLKWRQRWAQGDFSLDDSPRSGRPPRFSPS
jgi:transposase